MDIAPGSLYRLEGWVLEEGHYDVSSYRHRDQNWNKIVFEGIFLDPFENKSANQAFSLANYVASIVCDAHARNITEKGISHILFMIPQDCDEIDPSDGFPAQFDSYSAYPESDYKGGTTRVFISRDNKVMELSRFKSLEILGQAWDDAVKDDSSIFLQVNSDLAFCKSEYEQDLGTSDDIPAAVISFVDSVASCLIDSPSDRPEWFHDLEQAAGAGVMRCAEQAGCPEIDILDLFYAVQESDQPAAQFILSRLNAPVIPETVLPSGLDTTQAQGFFELLVATGYQSGAAPEWYKDVCESESADSLLCAAKKAGFSMTIEEFAEVARAADGDDEEATADWIFMKNILG